MVIQKFIVNKNNTLDCTLGWTNGCVSANILISCETSEDIFVGIKDSKNVYVTSPVREIDVYEQRAGVSNKANWVTEREGLTISYFGEIIFRKLGL